MDISGLGMIRKSRKTRLAWRIRSETCESLFTNIQKQQNVKN